MNVQNIPLIALVDHCREETTKYFRYQPCDTSYCFELCRRALADHDQEAFGYVYELYKPQVQGWILKHSAFAPTNESLDYFVDRTMESFHHAVSNGRFKEFSSLEGILSYLRRCVHTSIIQYYRGNRIKDTVPIDSVQVEIPSTIHDGIDLFELWQQIDDILPHDNDRLLARCVFSHGMKPRHIVSTYPTIWNTEREVSIATYRIRRTLRNSSKLRRFLGLQEETDKPTEET